MSQLGDEPAPLRFRVPFRCHMRLGGRSPLTKLIWHGSFVLPPEGFIARVHNEINELALRDLQLLPLDTLEIDACGRRLEVTVDMRNTQFIGADRTVGAFPDGYEPDILALMDMLIGPDDTFIDIGANWGYMSIHCLLRPDFRGRVIAIEPGARPRRDLQKLLRDCGFEDRMKILPYAIGDRDGGVQLSPSTWSGNATTIDASDGEPVDMRCFDHLNLPAASLIKVDIEGSEAAFVRGARQYIKDRRPSIIFESCTDTPGGDWAGPYALLEQLGYKCFAALTEVKHPSPKSSFVEVALHPASAKDRSGFPLHLNVLAVVDPAILVDSRFRLETPT